MSKRHYLFIGKDTDEIRLDYTPKFIEKVIKHWSEGKTHDAIADKLKLKKIELALIVMDLDYRGMLPEREGGFWGKQ